MTSVLLPSAVAAAGPASAIGHLYGIARAGFSYRLVPFDIDVAGGITERNDHGLAVVGGVRSMIVGRDARTVYVGAPSHMGPGMSFEAGALQVYAVAADGSLSLRQSVAAEVYQLALTPDGSRLFVRLSSGQIVSYPVAADGTLGSASVVTTTGGGGALSLAIRPDGATLYASVYPSFLEQWGIGAGGALTPLSPTDVDLGGCQSTSLGSSTDGAGLDVLCNNPNGSLTFRLGDGGALAQVGIRVGTAIGSFAEDVRGRGLYIAVYPHWIEQVQRQLDGTLLDFPAGAITQAASVTAVAADPSGTRLAVSTSPNALELYPIAQDGSLAVSPSASVPTTADSFDYLAFAPDQPAVAAVSAHADAGAVAFDASGSQAVNGTIARYDWSFGDGTALADAGPTPIHTYAGAGDYTATVTLTDSAGCSLAGAYNGAMSICAGSRAAAASVSVHVDGPAASMPAAAAPAVVAPAASAAKDPPPRPLSARAAPNVRGDKVLLTWKQPDGVAPPTRYLLAWSTLHSAHGPDDANMHHLYWTAPHILLRTSPRTTLHVAVYAQMADGTFTRATKTTLRLAR